MGRAAAIASVIVLMASACGGGDSTSTEPSAEAAASGTAQPPPSTTQASAATTEASPGARATQGCDPNDPGQNDPGQKRVAAFSHDGVEMPSTVPDTPAGQFLVTAALADLELAADPGVAVRFRADDDALLRVPVDSGVPIMMDAGCPPPTLSCGHKPTLVSASWP